MIVTLDDLAVPAETSSMIGIDQALRVQATLGEEPNLVEGDELPLLWHWMYFLPLTPTTDLGSDGHPRVSRVTEGYKRRMWAAGQVSAGRPLRIGRWAVRNTEIATARETTGRSGDLLLVSLRHTYIQDGQVSIVEDQTLVYRKSGERISLPCAGGKFLSEDGWISRYEIDERLLFRFSALTFNTHRIHYDRTYARECEGYPDLVVHGPLTAVLAERDMARHCGKEGSSYRFKAKAPLFVGQPFWLQGTCGSHGATVRALRIDGVEAFEASAGNVPSIQ